MVYFKLCLFYHYAHISAHLNLLNGCMQTLTELTFKMLNWLYKVPYLSKAKFSWFNHLYLVTKILNLDLMSFSLKDKMFRLLM